MAISDAQKLDLLFKKVGFGVAKTDVNSSKSAANEAIASPALLRGDNVWNEADQIPALQPSVGDPYVTVYSDANNNTIETTEDNTSSNNRTWKTGLTNWIPVEFGATYLVKVYAAPTGTADPESSGTRLFGGGSGNNDEWYFDYSAGVLNFIGDNLPIEITGSNVIYVAGARYTGTLGVSNLAFTASNLANQVDSDLSTSSSDQVIDSFLANRFRTVKYLIQMEHDSTNKYHATEILLTHDDTDVFFTEYATVETDTSLGEFSASLAGGTVSLTVTPNNTNTGIKAKRISIDD